MHGHSQSKIAQLDHTLNALNVKESEVCCICLEANDDTCLDCGHSLHLSCLAAQLEAKWNGPRITFAYVRCPLCRIDMSCNSTPEVAKLMKPHIALRDRVFQLCASRALLDGSMEAPALEQQAVLDAMTAFECGRCREIFCGGKAECGDTEYDASSLRCQACAWRDAGSTMKCNEHGPNFAVYKCDSCCSVATFDCSGRHYCDRCHARPSDGCMERPTCRGRPCDKCPLDTPHPENRPRGSTAAKHGFIVGCTKCLGVAQHCDQGATSSQTRQSFYEANT